MDAAMLGVAITVFAMLAAKRLGDDWEFARGKFWGAVLCFAGSLVMLAITMLSKDAESLRILGFLANALLAGGVITLFAGVASFRPLED